MLSTEVQVSHSVAGTDPHIYVAFFLTESSFQEQGILPILKEKSPEQRWSFPNVTAWWNTTVFSNLYSNLVWKEPLVPTVVLTPSSPS